MLLNYRDRGNGCFQHCIWPLAQIEALEAQENISISTLISISMDFGNQSSLLSLPSICDSSQIPPQLQSTTMSSNNTTTNDSKKRKNREESYMNESNIQQVRTPTLPTAIPLKSSSSRRATLVYNLFLNETMLAFNL
jgi:hypothetical protein